MAYTIFVDDAREWEGRTIWARRKMEVRWGGILTLTSSRRVEEGEGKKTQKRKKCPHMHPCTLCKGHLPSSSVCVLLLAVCTRATTFAGTFSKCLGRAVRPSIPSHVVTKKGLGRILSWLSFVFSFRSYSSGHHHLDFLFLIGCFQPTPLFLHD